MKGVLSRGVGGAIGRMRPNEIRLQGLVSLCKDRFPAQPIPKLEVITPLVAVEFNDMKEMSAAGALAEDLIVGNAYSRHMLIAQRGKWANASSEIFQPRDSDSDVEDGFRRQTWHCSAAYVLDITSQGA
jgi:hypothetical protein